MKLFQGLVILAGFGECAVNSSPNEKLKKLYRNGVDVMNIMAQFSVSKSEAKEALEIAKGDGENEEGLARLGDDRRESDYMISSRIHQSWTKKYTNQFKFLQRKFNSWECKKYGTPDNEDVEKVWGKIIDKEGLEDHFSQFKKLIWNSQPMSVRHVGNQTPLTALWLTFGKIRMWIDENIDVCIDQKKLDSLEGSKGNKAINRVKTWVNKGHKKFNTMERRVCSHFYKGLVRTKPEDNPYKDNEGCDPKNFRKKHRDMINEEKQKKRAEKQANRKRKNKQ